MRSMRKRFWSALLAFCMVAGLLPGTALATEGGTCGENLTWSLSGGVLTIQGAGGMDDFSFGVNDMAPWGDEFYHTVVIHEGVLSIGDYAFYNNESLAVVQLPDTLLRIGNNSFWYCSSLASVTIPDGVTTIGENAFAHCHTLASITIPNSVLTIGNHAFMSCFTLSAASIGNKVISIGNGAFRYCRTLEYINISSGLVSVGQNAFEGCSNLTEVYYASTEEAWNRVAINSTGNKALLEAQIHFLSASTMPSTPSVPSTPTDPEDSCAIHKYTSAGGDYCTVCGHKYEPTLTPYTKTMYAVVDNAAVRNKPYAVAGTLVNKLTKGASIQVTHYFYNSLGSKWYLTADGDYIYSERVTATGPSTNRLTFVANGAGVVNLPNTVNIIEGTRYAIPGTISGVPERSGYTFLGYSTSKDAESAEYRVGSSIMLTRDTTLYAVWKEANYSKKIAEVTSAILSGTHPFSQISPSDEAADAAAPKYWSWYYGRTSSSKAGWCAVYASWLMEQGGVTALKSGSQKTQASTLKRYGCYRSPDGYTPQTGDLAFFDWENDGVLNHVGVVVIDGGKVCILHGNYSDKVVYSKNLENSVSGYGDMAAYIAATSN